MGDKTLPDYLLEQLALDEFPESARRAAQERLAREPGGAQRLEQLRASDADLLARHPPAIVAKEIARRQRAVVMRFGPKRRIAWLAAPAAVLAATLLIVVQRPEQTTVKGDASLLVYTSRGAEPALLLSGSSARAGEVVQLGYIRSGPVYGAIVSLDGAGTVTLHLPEQGVDAVRLVPDARTLLPHAFALDAAPGFERFFLVTSEVPFRVSIALEAARTLAGRGDPARTDPLALPPKFVQTSFVLVKTDR